MPSPITRKLTIFFNDGTKLSVSFPKQVLGDAAELAASVRKAIDADKLALEMNGGLFIIPMRNVKYVQVTPAPEALPAGVIRGAAMLA